jgi:polyphosphate kinase 2 (PPK2 family)
MLKQEILDHLRKLVYPFRITKGEGFHLKDFDLGDTGDLMLDKGEAAELLQRGTEWLAEEQNMVYAQDRWPLLLIFQAMDAADHDFMWRYLTRLPERGRIGIFNRSYYEEVLVVRVHPEILNRQKLPAQLVSERI